MNEQLLVDLMGELDVSLLEESFMQKDILLQDNIRSRNAYFRNGEDTNLQMLDTRRCAIISQIEHNERFNRGKLQAVNDVKAEIEETVENKVAGIRRKYEAVVGIVSGVAAMTVLVAGVIRLVVHKRSAKFVVS